MLSLHRLRHLRPFSISLGLVPVPDPHGQSYLDAELVKEVRANLPAGEGIVQVELNGRLGELWLVATCEDVMIECSGRLSARAHKVDCQLSGLTDIFLGSITLGLLD